MGNSSPERTTFAQRSKRESMALVITLISSELYIKPREGEEGEQSIKLERMVFGSHTKGLYFMLKTM